MRARALIASILAAGALRGAEIVEHPFTGVTAIARTETAPRPVSLHIIKIDLTSPGIGFELTPPGGKLETVRQTTVDFLNQVHAQVAINVHYFLPFPSKSKYASLVGLAVSNGKVYSAFEKPKQSYAIVANAPAINIDASNHAAVVHRDTRFKNGRHVLENVTLWNAVAGSAQIVTNGLKTIPTYTTGLLKPGGRAKHSSSKSWYDATNARSAIGLSQDSRTLFLFTVDRAAGSRGMMIGEVADLLIRDYGVYNALNLDGGGSTTLAMQDPSTHTGRIVNKSSDNPRGRSVGSNLAVFAASTSASVRIEHIWSKLFYNVWQL